MVQFSALPDDIHALIINELFYDYNSFWTFKSNLYLLAVSNTWRRLALSLVYKKAYIIYGKSKIQSNANNQIHTNIGLVDCMDVIKDIYIKVYYYDDPIPGLEKVAELLGCNAKRLDVALYPTQSYIESREETVIKIADITASFANALPSLTALEYSGYDTQAGRAFMRYMVTLYANQLEVLKSRMPFSANCELTQLKELCVSAAKNQCNLPKIRPDKLESLSLLSASDNMSWEIFQFGAENDAVTFPNLNFLEIKYASDDSIRRRPSNNELIFPQLITLDVCCDCTSCPILKQAKLPPHVKKIKVAISGEAYYELRNLKLPTADFVEVRYIRSEEPLAQVPLYMCQLVKDIGRNVHFTFHNTVVPIAASDFTCPNITTLSLSAYYDVSAIAEIITRLPNLQNCSISNISKSDSQGILGTYNSLEPFAAPIRKLRLDYKRGPSYGLMEMIAIFLVLKMPQLKKLIAHEINSSFDLERFAWEYPHVKDIELVLKVW